MERLKYIVEDSTIVELLGRQNFRNKEAAILELVKNSYDAKASLVELYFNSDEIIISDDGEGMSSHDIKENWMSIGKSNKEYMTTDFDGNERIVAGQKGIGRFALARLGGKIKLISRKMNTNINSVLWETDWNEVFLSNIDNQRERGTRIVVTDLREKWNKKSIEGLSSFLSRTYNDSLMEINVIFNGNKTEVKKYFQSWAIGIDCKSIININYNSKKRILTTIVNSDEFTDEAIPLCKPIDIHFFKSELNMVQELKSNWKEEFHEDQLEVLLTKIGDFTSEIAFAINSTSNDKDDFLYKYMRLPKSFEPGIVLYRNAFSVASYDGSKDWLELDKRARESPAAATHPTGRWRVRRNQLAGKIEIDKKVNEVLKDMSNRQGIEEDTNYQLFTSIIIKALNEFEDYRQSLIRRINVKNIDEESASMPIIDKILANPDSISELSEIEAEQLVTEIKDFRKEENKHKRNRKDSEKQYIYDIRILNVLATNGLIASSIAHETANDRNQLLFNYKYIVESLKEYNMWNTLNLKENTNKAYRNVPELLVNNKIISEKVLAFMNTILHKIEKSQFSKKKQSISLILDVLRNNWQRDYARVKIEIIGDKQVFSISEDVINVIFDNLILNSIQQNTNTNPLKIEITIEKEHDRILFCYSDNGKGLNERYLTNPRRILEVHETTKENGHGLGMWIVHNTIISSGGEVIEITGNDGFFFKFIIGDRI